MELGLKEKNVIITGGGNNIGRAITLAFAGEGCNVAIAELNHVAGKRVAGEVAAMENGATATVIDVDVTDRAKTEAMISEAIARLGSVDVLVNNVGWTIDRLFTEKSRDEHAKEVDVNLWGAINCIHAVLPHMIDRQCGSVVSISSDAGRMGEYREAVYSACKAGVIALSKSLARETGRYELRFNIVCPGLVAPPQSEVAGLRQHVGPRHGRAFHGRCPGEGETCLPIASDGFRTGGRERGGVPGFGCGQLYHGPDAKRFGRLHDDVTV